MDPRPMEWSGLLENTTQLSKTATATRRTTTSLKVVPVIRLMWLVRPNQTSPKHLLVLVWKRSRQMLQTIHLNQSESRVKPAKLQAVVSRLLSAVDRPCPQVTRSHKTHPPNLVLMSLQAVQFIQFPMKLSSLMLR